MPSVVNGVRGRFIASVKTKVRVNGFNVEADDLLALVGNNEGEGDIGTKGVPEDVS